MKIIDVFKTQGEITRFNPYIIAEAGVNHEGSIDIARRLIDEAAEGGADAIKFQTYKANTLASKNSPSYWDLNEEPTTSQFELFKKHDKFWKDEFEILKGYCDKVGIEFMSTPFDIESAIFLNEMMDAFKISSSDITNKPFIQFITKFNKPIILSTGASFISEIEEAIQWMEGINQKVELALLHCMLNYPTSDENAHLGMITGLKRKFPERIIGYSDHTLPKDMIVSEISTLLGSAIIEKHFTHDKNLKGNDHYHSMNKDDLKLFKSRLLRIKELIGSEKVTSLKNENIARQNARRSLVAAKAIPKGKVIEFEDLTFKRPAYGISPKYIDSLIGKKALLNIKEDDILKWNMFEF